MALINCEECGHEMSDKAKSCPKCGWVNTSQPHQTIQKSSGKTWLVVAIICVLVACGAGLYFLLAGGNNQKSDTTVAAIANQESEEASTSVIELIAPADFITLNDENIDIAGEKLLCAKLHGLEYECAAKEMIPSYGEEDDVNESWNYTYQKKDATGNVLSKVEIDSNYITLTFTQESDYTAFMDKLRAMGYAKFRDSNSPNLWGIQRDDLDHYDRDGIGTVMADGGQKKIEIQRSFM